MRRYSIAVQLLTLCLLSIVSSGALANIPPDSAAQASADFAHRRDAMVRRLIRKLVYWFGWDSDFKPSLWGRGDKPRERARDRVAMASAVLWVMSHPSDFDNDVDDAYNLLQDKAVGEKVWSINRYISTLGYWVGYTPAPQAAAKINRLFKAIYYFAEDGCVASVHVGTKCDYDMVLVDLAHLLYTFRDGDTPLDDHLLAGPGAPTPPDGLAWTYADFLTNDMIYNIICQGTGPGGWPACSPPAYTVHYAFKHLDDDLTFRRYVNISPGLNVIQAETENHVLNIVTWDYLITNWVMWQGGLINTGSRREYDAMSDLRFYKMGHWFAWSGDIYERVLKVTGRVVHSGMYETNSRPYGRISLSALLALANFANPFGVDPPGGPVYSVNDVKRGARNAVDYLAAKYAFQSLRGKRQGPMRRNRDYRKKIDFYSNNGFVKMMSLLSGAYEWNDCVHNKPDPLDGGRWKCPILRWGPNTGARASSYAAMVSSWVGGYRIPDVIQEQMFERGPFYARMKSRYTKKHYPVVPAWPEYFVNDTEAFYSGDDRSSFELYFGDDYILLSAGGSHTGYYFWTATSDFYAKPTMLIPRGDFGHWGDAKGADPPSWRRWPGGSW
jgi:hypothetical protein